MVKNQADKQSYGNDVAATMDDSIDRNRVHRVNVDDSDNNNNNAYIIAEDDHDDEFSYEGSDNIPETYKDKQLHDFFDALNDNFTFDAGFDSGQKAIVPCLCPFSNYNKKWQEQVEKCGETPHALMDHLQRNGRNNEFVLHRGVKTYLKELYREGEQSFIGGQGSKVPEVGAGTERGKVGDSIKATVEGKHGEEGQRKEGVERSPTV